MGDQAPKPTPAHPAALKLNSVSSLIGAQSYLLVTVDTNGTIQVQFSLPSSPVLDAMVNGLNIHLKQVRAKMAARQESQGPPVEAGE